MWPLMSRWLMSCQPCGCCAAVLLADTSQACKVPGVPLQAAWLLQQASGETLMKDPHSWLCLSCAACPVLHNGLSWACSTAMRGSRNYRCRPLLSVLLPAALLQPSHTARDRPAAQRISLPPVAGVCRYAHLL